MELHISLSEVENWNLYNVYDALAILEMQDDYRNAFDAMQNQEFEIKTKSK